MIPRKNILVTIDSTPSSDDPLKLDGLFGQLFFMRGVPLPLPTSSRAVRLQASGGTGGYVYDITEDSNSGLPPGLTLDPSTGKITGTPTTVGHYMFSALVQDSSATVALGTFSIEVLGILSPRDVTPLDGEIGVPYTYAFTVIGATGSVTWSQTSGTIPAGLTLSAAGVLSGTPTVPDGISYFTATATDSGSGDTLDIACRIQIYAELSISPQTLNFTVGIYGEFQIQTTGGKAPISFLNDSTGPFTNGLSMSPTGLVSGIALAVNQQARNIKCSDSLGGSDSAFIILKAKQTNSILQPQKNTVDVGPEGPSKINLVEGANVTIAATNNGTTATYEISATAAPGGGVDTVNGVGPDSSGNVNIPTGIDLLRIDLFSGSASTVYGSTTKRVAGGSYFDPTDPVYGLSSGSTATLCMLLESTSGSVAAAGELFQKSGTGSPQIIAATSTTTSTTAALVTADVSAAFTDTSAPGIFVARFWIVTPNGLNQATCTGAWIEVTP